MFLLIVYQGVREPRNRVAILAPEMAPHEEVFWQRDGHNPLWAEEILASLFGGLSSKMRQRVQEKSKVSPWNESFKLCMLLRVRVKS
jgi:hypothetical protein